MQVNKADLLTVGNLKAPIGARRFELLMWDRVSDPVRSEAPSLRTAPPRIHQLIIRIIRRPRRLRHILPRAGTRINESPLTQRFPRRQIMLSPFALRVRPNGSPAIRPLGPRNSQPAQVLDHRFHKLGTAPLRIQVFIPKNQLPAAFRGSLRRNPKRPRMAEVQQTCGRRRQPPAIGEKRIR